MSETVQKSIFGEWLRKSIEEKGMTISAVARMSGFSREHLYKIMSGDSGTKIETVDALAKAIGISSKEAREAWYSSMYASAPVLDEKVIEPGYKVVGTDITSTYREQKGGVVKEEMLSADIFIKLSQEMGFLTKSVYERIENIERRFEQNPPATLIELDGKGGQKVMELSDDIQKQIAELNAKMDLLLKKSEEKR